MRINARFRSIMLLIAVVGIGLAILADWRRRPIPRTIYVPVVKAQNLSRQERYMMTELVIMSIERSSPLKVVSSPELADVIYDWGQIPAR